MQAIWRLLHIRQALLGCLALLVGMVGCTASLPQLPAPTERPPVSGVGEEHRHRYRLQDILLDQAMYCA